MESPFASSSVYDFSLSPWPHKFRAEQHPAGVVERERGWALREGLLTLPTLHEGVQTVNKSTGDDSSARGLLNPQMPVAWTRGRLLNTGVSNHAWKS